MKAVPIRNKYHYNQNLVLVDWEGNKMIENWRRIYKDVRTLSIWRLQSSKTSILKKI